MQSWGFYKKLLYYAITSILGVGVVAIYLLWLDTYNMEHPDVTEATAMVYIEELPLNGVLVWDEQILRSPLGGVVTYPSPQPRRVAKGGTVAVVDGTAVKADAAGYFLPALDGQEEEWVYARLWPGAPEYPYFHPAEPLEDGATIRKGDALGKLIPQPQDLRCIAYLDRTPSLERDIGRGFVNIRMGPQSKTQRAVVRTKEPMGQKIKVYLTLPFFPPHLLLSRAFFCSAVAEDMQGVAIPDTAVILREGKQEVLLVKGNLTEFTEVDGFPVDKDNFFITKGLIPGSIVVLYASSVKAGVIRW